jgi:hypothetical protein
MREGEAVSTRAPRASRKADSSSKSSAKSTAKSSTKSNVLFIERRRRPRPRLAESRRGATLNLLPTSVVTDSVRIVEFLLIAALGFSIYLITSRAAGRAPTSSTSSPS